MYAAYDASTLATIEKLVQIGASKKALHRWIDESSLNPIWRRQKKATGVAKHKKSLYWMRQTHEYMIVADIVYRVYASLYPTNKHLKFPFKPEALLNTYYAVQLRLNDPEISVMRIFSLLDGIASGEVVVIEECHKCKRTQVAHIEDLVLECASCRSFKVALNRHRAALRRSKDMLSTDGGSEKVA